MQELKRSQGSTFDTIARRKLVEDRDTIHEFTGKMQDCRMKPTDEWIERFSRCWISTQWTFPRCQSTYVFPTSSRSWWNAKRRSQGMPSRREGPPSIWDTHGKSGNVFPNRTASSSASNVSEHTSPQVVSESQTPVQDQRCQSGPSARSSVIPSEGDFQRIMGQTNNDCGSQIFILTNSPRQKMRWGVHLFTISCRNCVVDQRSGDGWFCGWFEIFIVYKRNSNARFWSARCEECFSTEQSHS